MADFSSPNGMVIQINSGSDSTPTWSTAIQFGGTAGANELRFCAATAGGAGIGSGSWPYYTRPGSATAINECWAFTGDTSGVKVATYTGSNANNNVFRINYDNSGTFATAPTLTSYADSSHSTTLVPNTIIGGNAGDTSTTGYLKANMWGTNYASGTNITTGGTLNTNIANTTLSATSGTAGSVSPAAGNWLGTWQSLQSTTQFITFPSVPAAVTASNIFFTLALYTGPAMLTGTLTPVITVSYSFS